MKLVEVSPVQSDYRQLLPKDQLKQGGKFRSPSSSSTSQAEGKWSFIANSSPLMYPFIHLPYWYVFFPLPLLVLMHKSIVPSPISLESQESLLRNALGRA